MRTPIPALRRALRIALPPVLAITGLTGVATPATAGPVPVTATSEIKLNVDDVNGLYDVCVSGAIPAGSLQVAGQWTLVIRGVRFSDAWMSAWQIDPQPWTSSAYSIDKHCELIEAFGYPYGQFDVDFGYVAAGEKVLAHSTGAGFWTPSSNGLQTMEVNPTPP